MSEPMTTAAATNTSPMDLGSISWISFDRRLYNIERLNIERFYNPGPDSPPQALGDEKTELYPLVRLG
jgi:hypothetical protein